MLCEHNKERKRLRYKALVSYGFIGKPTCQHCLEFTLIKGYNEMICYNVRNMTLYMHQSRQYANIL